MLTLDALRLLRAAQPAKATENAREQTNVVRGTIGGPEPGAAERAALQPGEEG